VKDLQNEGIERLLDTDATPFERQLLHAGADERPAPALLLAMQSSLGIGPDVVPPRGDAPRGDAPSPTASAAKPWAAGALVKAGVGATIGAGLIVGALSLRSGEPKVQPASSPTALVAPAPNVEVSPAPPAPPPASEPSSGGVDAARQLRLEIEQLDRVRSALSAGDRARALGLLDAYAARFPAGILTREAQVLRGKASSRALPGAPR
jgi:hypothetical protein